MFTKQHFIQIAKMLKNQRLDLHTSGLLSRDLILDIINKMEIELIDIFYSDERFDIAKFKQASNLSQEELRLAI